MRNQINTTSPKIPAGQSYTPAVPLADCTKTFVDGLIIPEGANSIVAKFVAIMDGLMQTPSFTFDSAIYAAKPYGLELTQLKELWTRYISVMESLNRVTVVHGAYDQPIICVI